MLRPKIYHSKMFTSFILVLGICFMAIGILRNEVPVMFEKAINICLECIGIG